MIAQSLLPEISHEYANTRKLLELVPFDKFDWKPHERSMVLGKLAIHIANIPGWCKIILGADATDVTVPPFPPANFTNLQELLGRFDENVADAKAALTDRPDAELVKVWSLKRGEHTIVTLPKVAALRTFAVSHVIHHRAQLQVYLRMLDIPVPGFYGPSADGI